ncbi:MULTISPECIES: PcfJ domain-containing protein [Pirellulaceae]|nr:MULTISPECIES: PcfJ domain-containing protein [Pirellulaceae]
MKHLFERYPVPNFLAFAWMRPQAKRWYHELYVHMAAGSGVRQFKEKPGIPLTPAAAKYFLKAPDHLSPVEAMRWAQIRAFGGCKPLALELVRNTILKELTRDERFWETVIRFLIREKLSYLPEASMLVDFIDQQKYQPAEKVWGRGGGPLPLQPEFTMKGRTLRSLQRHMYNWRKELLLKQPSLAKRNFHWDAIEVQPMVHQDGNIRWLIFELLNDRALMLEGAAMDHCVGDYVEQCAERKSSIWSLRIHAKGCPKRMVTIEIDPERKAIVQANAKSNEDPSPAAKEILQRWATREGLAMCLEE